MRKYLSTAIAIVLVMTMYIQCSACTVFCKQQNGRVLAGNNEDWTYSIPSTLWIAASGEGTYGRICFGNSTYVQGGMNEKGLFYDGATCPGSKVPYFEGMPELGMNLGEVIISKCANVQEVVEMIKRYNIPQGYSDHLMFADASGASVVIEWVEDEFRVIQEDKDYQLITNFWLSNPKLGWYPCNRYDKAKTMLEDSSKEISVNDFAEILEATKQDWGDGGTKYSNVYDLTQKEVFVYSKGNFSRLIRIRLEEELKNMEMGQQKLYDLEELFGRKELVIASHSAGGNIAETAPAYLPLVGLSEAAYTSEGEAGIIEKNRGAYSQEHVGRAFYFFIFLYILRHINKACSMDRAL